MQRKLKLIAHGGSITRVDRVGHQSCKGGQIARRDQNPPSTQESLQKKAEATLG